jgi:hypothetical protein
MTPIFRSARASVAVLFLQSRLDHTLQHWVLLRSYSIFIVNITPLTAIVCLSLLKIHTYLLFHSIKPLFPGNLIVLALDKIDVKHFEDLTPETCAPIA